MRFKCMNNSFFAILCLIIMFVKLTAFTLTFSIFLKGKQLLIFIEINCLTKNQIPLGLTIITTMVVKYYEIMPVVSKKSVSPLTPGVH